MATRDQEQFASPWSPRTHLIGRIRMNLWGRTAGMASTRLSSAQTAASTGETCTGQGWGEVRIGGGWEQAWGQAAVTMLPLSRHRQNSEPLLCSLLCQQDLLSLKSFNRQELQGIRTNLSPITLEPQTFVAGPASP